MKSIQPSTASQSAMPADNRRFGIGDLVFANIVKGGREIVALSFTGVRTLADIVNYLRGVVGHNLGYAVMKVRNYTQGWSIEQPVMIDAGRTVQGIQLSLF